MRGCQPRSRFRNRRHCDRKGQECRHMNRSTGFRGAKSRSPSSHVKRHIRSGATIDSGLDGGGIGPIGPHGTAGRSREPVR
jgi:hypothetical protein